MASHSLSPQKGIFALTKLKLFLAFSLAFTYVG